jgi:hypothetical protein
VSPYFQVLALVKSFQREVHPTLIKQELQTINCIEQELVKSFQREVHPTLIKQELQIINCIEQHTSITDKLIKIVKLST